MRNNGNSERLYFGGSKITADGDCSHEMKRCLLLGRKAMTNLDSVLKSRDIALPTKNHIVKIMVLPVVMYGCESWTIKKTEHWKTDPFKLWCWRRFLRAPWTARRSSQSILKEINPEYSFKELMLKLKLQYFGHLMWRVDSLEDSDAGQDWRQEEKGTIQSSQPLSSTSSPALNLFQHQGLFQWVGSLYWVAKVLELQPSNEYSGLISFKINWFDLLAVQGTLKSLLQHHG